MRAAERRKEDLKAEPFKAESLSLKSGRPVTILSKMTLLPLQSDSLMIKVA